MVRLSRNILFVYFIVMVVMVTCKPTAKEPENNNKDKGIEEAETLETAETYGYGYGYPGPYYYVPYNGYRRYYSYGYPPFYNYGYTYYGYPYSYSYW